MYVVPKPYFQVAKFKIYDVTPTLQGIHCFERWNGWAVPYFKLKEIKRILRAIKDPNFFFSTEKDCVIEVEDGLQYKHLTITHEGEKYYQIGDGWVWQIVD